MADFDLEQLKTLFDNLADRLDKTKGDQLSRDELYKVRLALTKMSNKANSASAAKSSKNKSVDPKDFASELVKEMRRQESKNPKKEAKKETKQTAKSETKAPPAKPTIIQQEITRRQTNLSGLTFLDRALRESAGEVTKFGDASKGATENLKEAEKRAAASNAAWAKVGGAAGIMVNKFIDVGGERIDYYRDILASGEGSIDSMQDLGRQAVAAGVTVEQFAKAMKEGTAGARLMGGIRWLALNKSITAMTKAGGAMGMTVEQIQAASQDYAEILRLQGLSRDRNTEQMAQGMLSLVRTSEATANILGKTREEAMAAQREQASNSNVQATMESQGLSDKQTTALNSFAVKMADTYGEAGRTLVNDIIQYGQPLNDSATQLAAAMPELQKMASQRVGAMKADGDLDVRAASYDDAKGISTVSREVRNDKDRLGQMAMLGGLVNNAFAATATTFTAGTAAGRNVKIDDEANAGTQQKNGSAERATNVGVLQLDGLVQHFKIVGEQAINTAFNPMVTTFGPVLENQVNPALHSMADGLIKAGQGLEGHTTGMATLTTGVLAASLAFTGFVTAMSTMSKIKGLFDALRGGGAAAGTAGRAGLAGRLLAGAASLPALGIMAGGAAVYGGHQMVKNSQKDESFWGTGKNDGGFLTSRGVGHGLSVGGGAAAGAAIGSLILPGAGTLIGAGAGAGLGLFSSWMANDDEPEKKEEKPKPKPKPEPKKVEPPKKPEPKPAPVKPLTIKQVELKKEPKKPEPTKKPEPKKEPPKPIVLKEPEPKKAPPKPIVLKKPVEPKKEPRILALPKKPEPKKLETPTPKDKAKEPAKPIAPTLPLGDRIKTASIVDTMAKTTLSNGAQAPKDSRAPSQPLGAQPKREPANATGQKNKNMLSADQMTNKIMDASERSAGILKSIKENSDKQVELMREDIASTRNMSDRLARLLEEGNKNTRSIADLSA